MFCKSFTIPQYNNTDAYGRPYFSLPDAAQARLFSLSTGAEFYRTTEQTQTLRADKN